MATIWSDWTQKKQRDNILNSMIYIEDVNIDKKYPDTLEINVTRCVAAKYTAWR